MATSVHLCMTVYFFVAFFIFSESSAKRGDGSIDIDSGNLNLPIQHAIGIDPGVEFTDRGSLSFRSLKSTIGTHIQTETIPAEFRDKLREASSNPNALYRVRVPTKITYGEEDNDKYVSSFIRACSLYESRLSDLLTVTIDPSGHVLGINIEAMEGNCHGDDVDDADLSNFNTTVELAAITTGPVPDTQAYIQKIEEEKAQREKGNSTEQKSFFGKYWMYIVPIVLFLMLSSAQDPNAQRGGGGGGGN
ncbi:ER membrane protein complex subunit 10-like [Ptychodera flava]|uniref:ER membrane protein complex subunit 10-like n=1 Tax=Ptychodera flava TaxID=63121 RepID=UPI00396A9DD2